MITETSPLYGKVFFGSSHSSDEIQDRILVQRSENSSQSVQTEINAKENCLIIEPNERSSHSSEESMILTPIKRKNAAIHRDHDSLTKRRENSIDSEKNCSSPFFKSSPTSSQLFNLQKNTPIPDFQIKSSSSRKRPKKSYQPDFQSLRKKRDTQISSIEEQTLCSDESEDEEEHYGLLFDVFLKEKEDEHLRISKETIIELGNLISSHISSVPKRGQKKILSIHDQLIVCLEWLSSKTTVKGIAGFLGLSETMASNSIREIRPYLLKVLDEIFKNPPRPPKFISKEFPSVALLVDATTVRCSVPVGDFDDARQLFDGHHNSYSMKIEVAVSAWPPFKALFVSESVPGGVHDVTLFRSGKHRYVEYLKKTEEEKLGNSVCNQNDSWSIMADKGYQGHFIDINVITPIKRIHKANKTLNEKEFQRSESESVYSLSSTQPSSLSSTQPSSLSSTQPSSLSSQPSFMSLSVSPLLSFPSASSSSSISPPADNLFIVPASVATTSTQSETLFTKAGMSVMTAKEVEIFNKKVAKHRIPVEWFFGRMKRLWLRMSEKYTGPREDFPADAKIACWLTNIVIDNNSLEADDGIFYRKVSEFSNKKETERKLIQEINARASMERKIIRKASK